MKSKNKINTLITSMIILSACHVNAPNSNKNNNIQVNQSNKISKNVITPAAVSSTVANQIPQINTTQDEEIIKQIINNNIEYFPEDIENDDSLEATVPNNGGVVFATVPNNGGVVFMSDPDSTEGFTTKALIDRIIEKAPLRTVIKNKLKEKVKNVVTSVVKRIGKSEKQYKITFNKDKTEAEVTIIRTILKEIILNRAINPLSQKFKEESITKSIFVKENGSWKLSQVSPSTTKLNNSQSKIKIESIKLTIHSNNNTKTTELDLDGFKNKTRLINITKDDLVTIEAKVSNGDLNQDNPLQVYARFAKNKTRIPMFDDGGSESILENESQISGDSVKNDDVYTVNLLLNNKKGVNHLILDVRNPLYDNSKSVDNFNYISKSIPILIM